MSTSVASRHGETRAGASRDRVTPGRRARSSIVDREIELRLVARLKAGDPAAFEAIYEAYRPRLFGFLVRLSRRRDVAEDLLEETWLRLVARAATLTDEPGSGRGCSPSPATSTQLAPASGAVDGRARRARACLAGDRRRPTRRSRPPRGRARAAVEAALARLPLRDRELLLLVGVEGLTPVGGGGPARAPGGGDCGRACTGPGRDWRPRWTRTARRRGRKRGEA